MKQTYKKGGLVAAVLILVGTAILVSQFPFNRSSQRGRAQFEGKTSPEDPDVRNVRELTRLAERKILARTYDHIDETDKRLARIEYQLEEMRKRLASDYGDVADALAKGPTPALRVLDAETLRPIKGVHVFCSSSSGGYGDTDADGVFEVASSSLRSGTKVSLDHPDYEIQQEQGYKLDLNNMATFLMRKGGDASLIVKVTLTVRGKRANNYCSVILDKAEKKYARVRTGNTGEDGTCHFSGIAPGDYTIRLRFYHDACLGVERPVQLSKGEHRIVQIDAKTDQVALIRVRGVVLNKRSGKPLQGVSVQFCGAPGYTATTGKDGRFSTTAHRAYFGQTYFYTGDRMIAYVVMDSGIPEELARNLEIHADPDVAVTRERLRDKDGDGVFCDKKGCVICERHRQRMDK